MADNVPTLVYSETEVRSCLPTGWGIRPGSTGRWDARARRWSIEVYDGADNIWKIEVDGAKAVGDHRLPALREAVDRPYRRGLGRKSMMG
jgi:hypothetical protein